MDPGADQAPQDSLVSEVSMEFKAQKETLDLLERSEHRDNKEILASWASQVLRD